MDKLYPKPDDTMEELQEKYTINMNAGWSEILHDTILPERDSDITEFQSNAMVAQKYMDDISKAQEN